MQTTTSSSDDDLIAAAIEAVENPPPNGQDQIDQREASATVSPTLAKLERARRPKPATQCESCPNWVWFSSQTDLKCYCRVMYLVTWSVKEPNQITACDGVYKGLND